jgi:hypothetical protein
VLKTKGCAFSTSSKSTTLYGLPSYCFCKLTTFFMPHISVMSNTNYCFETWLHPYNWTKHFQLTAFHVSNQNIDQHYLATCF